MKDRSLAYEEDNDRFETHFNTEIIAQKKRIGKREELQKVKVQMLDLEWLFVSKNAEAVIEQLYFIRNESLFTTSQISLLV